MLAKAGSKAYDKPGSPWAEHLPVSNGPGQTGARMGSTEPKNWAFLQLYQFSTCNLFCHCDHWAEYVTAS